MCFLPGCGTRPLRAVGAAVAVLLLRKSVETLQTFGRQTHIAELSRWAGRKDQATWRLGAVCFQFERFVIDTLATLCEPGRQMSLYSTAYAVSWALVFIPIFSRMRLR